MKSTAPQKLTSKENQKLDHCFFLSGWEFDKIVGNNCVKISDHFIGWQKEGTKSQDGKWIGATLYGLEVINTSTRKPVMCQFFLQYKSRVYQPHSVSAAVKLVELLEKEFKWNEYLDSPAYAKAAKIRKLERLKLKKSAKKSAALKNAA